MSEYVEEVQEDGSIARRYSDGALRRPDGAYIEQPPQAAPTIDAERSKLLLQRKREIKQERKALARDEAERALQRATRSRTPAEGWGKLTGAVAKRVLDGDEPLTGVVTAYKAVGESTGMRSERGPTQATQVNITLSAEAAQSLQDWGVVIDGDQPSEYASE